MKQFMWIFLSLTLSTFSQTPGGGVTDIDGIRYNSVIIGTQEWMKENLKVSKYTDGTIIPQVTDPTAWANLTTGAWCYYNNDPANGTIYGKLYNWYAVAGIHDTDPNTPNKILAPLGWHIPSNSEWTTLSNYLGGELVAGGKMKSTGTSLWQTPNTAATNESGFAGIPGGFFSNSSYTLGGGFGCLWSSSASSTNSSWSRLLNWDNGILTIGSSNMYYGFSVRCLWNSPLSNTTFETNDLKLFPNPVVNILNIKAENNLINQSYTIIDGLGRVVINGKLNEVESTINVEQLSKGIYYLKISGYSANKFIKE